MSPEKTPHDDAAAALREAREREAATREILAVISRSRDDETPVFEAILRNASRLCKAPLAFLPMANEARTHVRVPAFLGVRPEFADALRDFDEPMEGSDLVAVRAVAEGQIIRSDDLINDPAFRASGRWRTELTETEGARSVLLVPLMQGGDAIGAIMLYRREVDPFDDDDVALVETFAAQAVIAIENVRQFRELQTRLERAAATRGILEVISRSRDDEQPVFEVILDTARRLCGATMAAFVLGREGGGPQAMVANQGATEETVDLYRAGRFPMDPDVSTAARAIVERRSIHLEDMADTDGYRRGHPNFVSLVDHEGIRTNLLVPLISRGEGIGCLILYRREVLPYTADQIALVETFAAQAVIAIENVRQFRELQTRLQREAATRQILQVISQSRDDETPVFDAILENAAHLCDAPSAWLHLVDPDGAHYVTVAHWGSADEAIVSGVKRPLDSPLGTPSAIREGRVVHTPDLADTDLYRERHPVRVRLVEEKGIRTFMAVPLMHDGKAIGCITLYRLAVAPFGETDIALVESFAAQAVIAIENVRQFRALQDRTEEVRAQAAELRTLNADLESRVAAQVGELERVGRLKRFLSPQVADAVMTAGDDSLLGSHRALIATLFCDLRGFTAFCETAEPEEAIEVLQAYHDAMGALVREHAAGVDHRAGDGIMVIFNDPLPCDDPAGSALDLALAMRERMAGLCAGWRRLGHRLGFGTGISLGYATVGMVGSEGRYDYTASGTAVNLAARLCEEAGDGEILLSPRAWAALEDRVQAEPAGALELKGISVPVEVVRVLDRAAAASAGPP